MSSSVPKFSRYQEHFSTQFLIMEQKLVFLEYCAYLKGGKIAVKAVTKLPLRTLLYRGHMLWVEYSDSVVSEC